MRCFVAIAIDDPWRAALLKIIRKHDRGSRGARWCTADQLHITLKFLGDVDDAAVPAVCRAIAAASQGVAPFAVRPAGLGCFPSRGWPRVLWAGVDDPEDGARRWLTAAEPLLEELGFDRERRPYHAHITLARAKMPPAGDALRTVSETSAPPAAPELRVSDVVLIESRLGRAGARYVPIHTAPLGTPESEPESEPEAEPEAQARG